MYTEKKTVLSMQKQYKPTHLRGTIYAIVTYYPKSLKRRKKRHYDNEIKTYTNKNKTWNIVNKETHRKAHSTNNKLLNIDGITTDNQQLIAGTFITDFAPIPENIKTTDRKAYMQNKITLDTTTIDTSSQFVKEVNKLRYTTFQSKPTTTTDTENIIKTLKPNNSFGYDKISTKLLKITAPFISSPLNYICNEVLTKGIFPDRLKYSIIKLLYKKGNKKDVSHYRPISLLPSFSKILEKLIQIRLLDHLHKNNIISKEQYGFRMGFTTENVVYKLINEVLNALNNKQTVRGIFCDLTKAFDCLDHDILTLILLTWRIW